MKIDADHSQQYTRFMTFLMTLTFLLTYWAVTVATIKIDITVKLSNSRFCCKKMVL